uniref:protein argonaute MEL1-like n=1 Tax=Erigeron canadensis TaxID=72917 RepID=UPI001CB90F4B|nr:protein argonaute MEL1-like [Erigeron canadensis]
MGMSLNLQMSARAYYQPTLVYDFTREFLGRDTSGPLSAGEHRKVAKAVKGLKVEVDGENYTRKFNVLGLTTEPLGDLRFVESYTPLNLNFPAILIGTAISPKYIPMELCRIAPGQSYPLTNRKQADRFHMYACDPPLHRKNNICMTVRDNKYNINSLVRVTEQMTTIDARVLPPPAITYYSSVEGLKDFIPVNGQWTLTDKNFVNAGTVNRWGIANFSRRNIYGIGYFCGKVVQMCRKMGMVFNPIPMFQRSYPPVDIAKILKDIKAEYHHLDLLFVILPDDKEVYAIIKRVCETDIGVITQCFRHRNVEEVTNDYLEHVALKINVKVGGRNTFLSAAHNRTLRYVSEVFTIIMGADVTHPIPGDRSSPSIAAVVASMDWPELTRYRAMFSAQSNGMEIIQDERLIREQLLSFYQTHGKPERIIYYRDGVGDSQFRRLLDSELGLIRKACESLAENYRPNVTFIVMIKRHNTRLFPSLDHDSSGNVLPGTVVDTQICNPTDFNFFLCSHAGIKGTSRPAHYYLLHDENGFTADGLERLTYDLCYICVRGTRSISIVAPVYYADLAAYRARCYIEGDRAERQVADELIELPAIHEDLRNVMFYC